MTQTTFFLDGTPVQADEGETVLTVAARAGLSIPTLCHHQRISHTTSCFVCVVRDEATGQFLPSCASVPREGQRIDASSPQVAAMRRSALELLLSEHTGDCEAPCTVACPAHARVEEYVRAGRDGDFLTALKIIKERIPLPLSIGRVCPRFCEKDCRRNIFDAPVAINEFKRLAADLHYADYLEELPPLGDTHIGIVGAGPAGLAAAYFLRRCGARSTLYESMPRPGGMLRYGIPEFRLPKAIVDLELAHFEKMGGIAFVCDTTVGRDISLDTLRSRHDAVIVTVGSQQPAPLRCAGEELALSGIDWLKQVALGQTPPAPLGDTVVVGGGNTAMDCVRTAVRLGATRVSCLYRRTEAEMPAEAVEVHEAREEGVIFSFLQAPVALERRPDGRIAVTVQHMELGEPDASGRRKPVPIPGRTDTIVADTVIAAVGQKTRFPFEVPVNRWGDADADPTSLQLADGLFAAGDCVTGPASVVEAVAQGRTAALAVLAQLRKEPYAPPSHINVTRGHWRAMAPADVALLHPRDERPRLQLRHVPPDERATSFVEVTQTATADEVRAEGRRCLECSCTAKSTCLLKRHAERWGAQVDALPGEKCTAPVDTRHPVIVHDPNKCIRCGICIKMCDEVVGQSLLGFKGRGFTTAVGPALSRPLPASCADCLACVDACPTGALDRKEKPAPTRSQP